MRMIKRILVDIDFTNYLPHIRFRFNDIQTDVDFGRDIHIEITLIWCSDGDDDWSFTATMWKLVYAVIFHVWILNKSKKVL